MRLGGSGDSRVQVTKAEPGPDPDPEFSGLLMPELGKYGLMQRVGETNSRRRVALVLAALFVVSRLVFVWLAIDQSVYPGDVQGDVDDVYAEYARQIENGEDPYVDLAIEYPPGTLPFLTIPESFDWLQYRTAFVLLMLLVDVVGLIGVWRVSRRWGSYAGVFAWIAGIPLLGPLAYVRLDLVAGAATIWAVERIAHKGWTGAGGWLGFGALAKLYPVLLLPQALVGGRRRGRLVAAFFGILILGILAVGAPLEPLWASIIGYHGKRGVHIESTWGLVLEALTSLSPAIRAPIEHSHYTYHYTGPVADLAKEAGMLLSLAAVVYGTWLSGVAGPDERERRVAATMFGTLATVVALGTIFSPQYVIWVIALAAVALCDRDSSIRPAAWLVLPVALLTQFVYPLWYAWIIHPHPAGMTVISLRNGLLLVSGLLSLWLIWRTRTPSREAAPAVSKSISIPAAAGVPSAPRREKVKPRRAA
jgi:hypothetical protein